MWEYYEGKSILVTGGSGFLGTAIVHRLLTRTSVSRVYLVCRGGSDKLLARWREWLPTNTMNELCDMNRLVVLDGDILLPGLGLSQSELNIIWNNTKIIIHAASSINLGSRLSRISPSIIGATDNMFDLALGCKDLDRFVYVSSAYTNTHLYYRSQERDVHIKEEIYDLDNQSNVLDELNEVRKFGTSRAYESENFPSAYAYAKHLTERLLQHRFNEHDLNDKLLIVRPAIIGPSQCLPFPGYIMPMSSPYTMLAAAVALVPYHTIRVASKMDEPELGVTGDEVPVDVVADRLLCHLAIGTLGCIHAVSGVRSRLKFEEWWHSLMKLRRIPWGLQLRWVQADWKSANQHAIPRLYAVCGASFAFSEDKTIALSQMLSGEAQSGSQRPVLKPGVHISRHDQTQDLQLYTQINTSKNLLTQTKSIRYAMDQYADKSKLAWLVLWLFYSDFGKTNSPKDLKIPIASVISHICLLPFLVLFFLTFFFFCVGEKIM